MLSLSQQLDIERIAAFVTYIGTRFRPVKMADSDSIKCPYCGSHMPAHWEPLYTFDERGDQRKGFTCGVHGQPFHSEKYEFDWMACFNDACKQVIVRVQKRLIEFRTKTVLSEEEWYAVPRKGQPRTVDPLVPDRYKLPYIKASLIIGDAPDLSGVASGRILAALLREYAGLHQRYLSKQIEEFIKDTRHPSRLLENLHYLREIRNFAAHEQADAEGNEIEIGLAEAEWTLNVIDDLFDYFIVGPEKDRLRRAAFDEKIQKAGRRAIKH